MNIFNSLFWLKKKEIEPKVLAMFLRAGTKTGLFMQSAYTLEEAATISMDNFRKSAGYGNDVIVSIEMWVSLSATDAFSKFIPEEPLKEENIKTIDKGNNTLIKKIIDSKDIELFTKSKSKLTKAEQRFIMDSLDIKE